MEISTPPLEQRETDASQTVVGEIVGITLGQENTFFTIRTSTDKEIVLGISRKILDPQSSTLKKNDVIEIEIPEDINLSLYNNFQEPLILDKVPKKRTTVKV